MTWATSAMSNPAASFEPTADGRSVLHTACSTRCLMPESAGAGDMFPLAYSRPRKSLGPDGMLMTTMTRISLDMLTSARARPYEYVGPLVTGADTLFECTWIAGYDR